MNKQEKILDELLNLEIDITSIAFFGLLKANMDKETCNTLLKMADKICIIRETLKEGVKRTCQKSKH